MLWPHAGLVQLEQGDMLGSDLSNVGVLLLANQCWDKQLMTVVSEKAASELPRGAVVLEYTGALEGVPGFQRLALVPAGPVSWRQDSVFHAWARV